MLTAQVVLPGLPSSVPTARHFVESVLTSWGDPERAWTGALLVSELATNCALHAGTEFTVRVSRTVNRVLIEVQDGSPRIPRPRSYGEHATTGRGLQLVDTLGAEWGITPTPDGKTVWVELVGDGGGEGDSDEPSQDIDLDQDLLLASFPDDTGGPVAWHRTAA